MFEKTRNHSITHQGQWPRIMLSVVDLVDRCFLRTLRYDTLSGWIIFQGGENPQFPFKMWRTDATRENEFQIDVQAQLLLNSAAS